MKGTGTVQSCVVVHADPPWNRVCLCDSSYISFLSRDSIKALIQQRENTFAVRFSHHEEGGLAVSNCDKPPSVVNYWIAEQKVLNYSVALELHHSHLQHIFNVIHNEYAPLHTLHAATTPLHNYDAHNIDVHCSAFDKDEVMKQFVDIDGKRPEEYEPDDAMMRRVDKEGS